MTDLVERVARAIFDTSSDIWGDHSETWEQADDKHIYRTEARAAIAAVRAADVERGPSEAEIEAMVAEMGKISGYGSSIEDLLNELGADDVDYMAVEAKETWAAAAKVRAEEVEG